MPDATVKRVDEMETFYDGMVTRARASLDVTSWGMQVFNFPPGWEGYPNHNHAAEAVDPGQEELYVPLAGSATLHVDDEEHELDPGVWARVGSDQFRRLVPGAEGLRLLVIGGTPGKAFVPPAWTELGAAPPQMP